MGSRQDNQRQDDYRIYYAMYLIKNKYFLILYVFSGLIIIETNVSNLHKSKVYFTIYFFLIIGTPRLNILKRNVFLRDFCMLPFAGTYNRVKKRIIYLIE